MEALKFLQENIAIILIIISIIDLMVAINYYIHRPIPCWYCKKEIPANEARLYPEPGNSPKLVNICRSCLLRRTGSGECGSETKTFNI